MSMSALPPFMKFVVVLVMMASLLTASIPCTFALEFDMLFQTKCVMEEISKNVLAVIDYEGFKRDSPSEKVPLSVKVEDPYGDVVYVKDNSEGEHYSFTTKRQGDYKTCFTAKDLQTAKTTKVRLDWKTGVAATDWDAIAKKDNLNAIAAELKRMEELTKEIHEEMLVMKQREMQMRDMNESTNSRVAWFSVTSLLVCVGLSIWQLYYLRSFFERKKLL